MKKNPQVSIIKYNEKKTQVSIIKYIEKNPKQTIYHTYITLLWLSTCIGKY